MSLDKAIEDCDAALSASDTLESRALVLLRLKRWQEAASAYDEVNQYNPTYSSTYAGAMAHLILDETPENRSAFDEARKSYPDQIEVFRQYGLPPPPKPGAEAR